MTAVAPPRTGDLVRTAARSHALEIWKHALRAVRPELLVREALSGGKFPIQADLAAGACILVVGAGKAGAAMALGVEEALASDHARLQGFLNVPGPAAGPAPVITPELQGIAPALPLPRAIRLHAARPAGSNHPTAEGVAGSQIILDLVSKAGPEDVCLCLISGGGSALLPCPVEGITLADKQAVTQQLHRCGATITEMNTVRKHLSRIKGGRLAETFRGRALASLLISDVIGDPLDVIGSGPTVPDSSTFADALAVLDKYAIRTHVSAAVLTHLEHGKAGIIPDTPKQLPGNVHSIVLGNNAVALRAAAEHAAALGYPVINLGAFLQGETAEAAAVLAGIVRSIQKDGWPARPPVCLLSGGETTVTLTAGHGRGGRNQEFVLAMLAHLGPAVGGVTILSGGTDGEDGPTDAAGALADTTTCERARTLGLSWEDHLRRHDAYPLFAATGDLLRTGLTHTNVMDVRIVLVTS